MSDGTSEIRRMELGRVILEGGPVLQEEMEEFLTDLAENGNEVARKLLESGCPGEDQLAAVIGENLKPPWLNLENFRIDPAVIDLVPRDLVEKHCVLPVAQVGPILCVSQIRPLDREAFRELRYETGLKIFPVFCEEQRLREMFQKYYEFSGDQVQKFVSERKERLPEKGDRVRSAVRVPRELSEQLKRDMARNREEKWKREVQAREPVKPIEYPGSSGSSIEEESDDSQ